MPKQPASKTAPPVQKMKSTKSLWRISVTTAPQAEDAVAELLGTILHQPASIYFDLETGTSTVAVYLQNKFMNRRAPAGRRRGSSVRARSRRPREQVRREILDGLKWINRCGLETRPGRITLVKMRREDWAESWKRHFQPIEIGDELLIKPSWSRRRARKNHAVVVLDPGLSFGTGQHPTTAFCLRELVRRATIEPRRSLLDIGTGSGILAIAAAKLGYSPVHAVDFDPEAIRVARANARANGVHKQVRISRGDVAKLPIRPARQYDLICANLIAPLLISARRRMVSRMRRDGTLVLAGILKPEFPGVQAVFEKLGLKLAASKAGNEWRSGSFRFLEISSGKFE